MERKKHHRRRGMRGWVESALVSAGRGDGRRGRALRRFSFAPYFSLSLWLTSTLPIAGRCRSCAVSRPPPCHSARRAVPLLSRAIGRRLWLSREQLAPSKGRSRTRTNRRPQQIWGLLGFRELWSWWGSSPLQEFAEEGFDLSGGACIREV